MIAGARDSAQRIGTVWNPKGDGNAVHNVRKTKMSFS